jgi:hypothetical protein
MASLGRVTAAVVTAAIGVYLAGDALGLEPVDPDSPRPRSTSEIKSDYLAEADAVCGRWLAKMPKAPKKESDNVKWTGNMAKTRPEMISEWARVPIPEIFAEQVRAVLDAQNAAAAALLEQAQTYRTAHETNWRWEAADRDRAARTQYRRLNATATQLAEAFGFDECANEWVVMG